MVFIVNTVVHNAIYENALELAERNKYIHAMEIEGWFDDAAQTVRSLSSALSALGSDGCFPAIAAQFVDDYNFIENIYIVLNNGYAITGLWGGPWYMPEMLDTPWFEDAKDAGGEIVVTNPYISVVSSDVVVSLAMWVPSLSGYGAVVGVSISIDMAIEIAHRLTDDKGGYNMLIGANHEIIYHPAFALASVVDGSTHYLDEIASGSYFIDAIASGERVMFYDLRFGEAYFIATYMNTPGWTFASVLPQEITRTPVMRSVMYIIFAFSTVLVTIFIAIMLIVWGFTRRMEDSRNTTTKLQAMFDASPMLCTAFDHEGNVLDVNSSVYGLFEIVTRGEYVNDFYKFSPKIQPSKKTSEETIKQYLEEVISTNKPLDVPYYLHCTKNGEELPCEMRFVPLEIAGERRIVAYARDLRAFFKIMKLEHDEKEQAIATEVAVASNKAKSHFLAGMSHEIRTPITAVMGITEIELRNPMISPHFEEIFTKIHSSAELLLRIINDILDISKIEAGKMEIATKPYDTPDIITDVAHVYATHLHDKDIEFSLYIAERLPLSLEGDILRIEQIVNNLLSNAFKYTVTGSVEMHVNHEPITQDTTNLVVKIKDTGIGMNDEQISKLFDEYAQFHTSTTITGTGLGMSIVNSLVKMMDAEIDVQSQENKGTTITVKIPQRVSNPEPLGADTVAQLQQFKLANSAVKRFKFKPQRMPYGRVLVVDDIEANVYVTKGLLAFYELSIETCDSGEKALDLVARGNTYDIIFMDQTMPGLSGTETMQKLREDGYTSAIVVLTANALMGQAEEFIKAGFDSFLSKPLQTELLNTVLVKYIKDKHPPEVVAAATLPVISDDIVNFQKDEDLLRKLRMEFATGQRHTYKKITAALQEGDKKTAHRLAHSLKGLAALIQENELSNLAAYTEHRLAADKDLPADHMAALEEKLNEVISSITTPPVTRTPQDNEKALRLLENLAPLLETKNFESQKYLDDLQSIPEAAIIHRQIQNLDLAEALVSLKVLVTVLEQ